MPFTLLSPALFQWRIAAVRSLLFPHAPVTIVVYSPVSSQVFEWKISRFGEFGGGSDLGFVAPQWTLFGPR